MVLVVQGRDHVLLGEVFFFVFDENHLGHCWGFFDLKGVDSEDISQNQEPLMLIDRVFCIDVDYLNIAENVVEALKLASVLATLQV